MRRLSKMYRESLPFKMTKVTGDKNLRGSLRLLGDLQPLHEAPHNPLQLGADRNELQSVVVSAAVPQDRSKLPFLRGLGKGKLQRNDFACIQLLRQEYAHARF